MTAWLDALRQQAWVVYCKPPFAGPDHVLAYLGRYTRRVALSNDRLLAVADGRVRFRWRDYADGDRIKVMELDIDEFLRRFLLHVVPDGFVRIRHFGLLANRRRAAALAQCRVRLTQPPPPVELPESVRALMTARHRHRHRARSRLSAGTPAAGRAAGTGARRLGHLMSRGSPRFRARPRRPRIPPLRPSSVPSSISAAKTRRACVRGPSLGARAPARGGRRSRGPPAPPTVPASRRALPTIESPYVMRARGVVQLVLSAMLDARRIKA